MSYVLMISVIILKEQKTVDVYMMAITLSVSILSLSVTVKFYMYVETIFQTGNGFIFHRCELNIAIHIILFVKFVDHAPFVLYL